MKKIILLVSCVVTINSCSSDDSSNSVNSNQFTGSFSAVMDAGIQNGVPVEVTISESNRMFNVRITGANIEPDIVLTGKSFEDVIILDECTDLCYQGDGNITDAGLIEIISGKRTIFFGVYFPEDGDNASDAILFTVEEKL
ncbi:hypothetical protein [uncultured Aquimarina sp.]|uniref:hypothetical protein n=1 Tax=uncultured Aquimarina sp. TaxID=575652 RepID=UPI00261B2934|nr:hypothetical protein [uncultured Aquimarina sp.]